MKSRYVFLLLTVLVFGNSLVGHASARHNTTSCLAQHQLHRTLVEDYVMPSIAVFALTGRYGLAGYWIMAASKRFGKVVSDNFLLIPPGALQRTVALDGKVSFNEIIKTGVTGGEKRNGMPILYLPALGELRKLWQTPENVDRIKKEESFYHVYRMTWLTPIANTGSFEQVTFDAANKGLSFEEFIRAIKHIADEFVKISSPDGEKTTPSDCMSGFEIFMYPVTKVSDTIDFLSAARSATINDPATVAIATSYFLTSWILCGVTRMYGDIIATRLNVKMKPFDGIIRTTVGLMASTAFQPYVIDLINSTANEFGYASALTNKLNDLAYSAGSKGPFGWDGITALIAGMSFWFRYLRTIKLAATSSQSNVAAHSKAD